MSDERISREKIEDLLGLWEKRYRNYKAILDRPFFVTPSSEEKKPAVMPGKMRRPENHKPVTAERAVLIGNIAHYVLSNWDFASDVSRFKAAVEDACSKFTLISKGETRFPPLVKGGKGGFETGYSEEIEIFSVQSELDGLFEKFSASPSYKG